MIESIIWVIIVPIAIAIVIYLLILKLINKYIFKDRIKINYKEFAIGWFIIFCFNLLCITFDIPYPIGVPYTPFADGGQTRMYASLGYIIKVEQNIFLEDDIPTTVSFLTLNNKEL